MSIEQPIRTREQNVEEVIAKVKEVLEKDTYIDDRDGGYGYEIYVNYDEEFGDEELAEISDADDALMAMNDATFEWIDNATDYYRPELEKTIRNGIGDELYDEYDDEIEDWICENVYFYLPKKVFEQEVDVVISLDTGDCNYDFTCCNVLNWYGECGGYGNGHELDKNSPIRWLANQQGRLNELNKALKTDELCQRTDFQKGNDYSKFTKTVIQELQNSCSHMNTLIFLCKMPLDEFCQLKELIASEKELNKSYYYEERKGEKTFTVSKDATCGLFDIWQGGGSVLGIELEKDVVIPTKAVFDVWIDCRGCRCNGKGYDVDDVYGLTGNAWSGEVKIA